MVQPNARPTASAADIPEVTARPYGPGQGLPLFLEPTNPRLATDNGYARAWLEASRPAFDELLTDVGAIVLRGFAVHTTQDFGALIESYSSPEFGYTAGATSRARIEGRVFEATRSPAGDKLGMHQEMAYLPDYPKRLAFYCLAAPDVGGETFIADMRRFDRQVSPRLRAELLEKGVTYQRHYRHPDRSTGNADADVYHRTWPEGMNTAEPDEAEAACRAMGLDYEWVSDGFVVKYHSAGFVEHPATGQRIWFNQIATQSRNRRRNLGQRELMYQRIGMTHPLRTTYGDGSEFDVEDIEHVNELLDELTVAFPWQHADVMLLDNFYTAHGRNTYQGHRDVQVALLND
jgi:alpha-ketoglutarate-dependent taurine dioxygenase